MDASPSNNENQNKDTFYFRPPKRNCWQSFKNFFWNPSEKTICGRTPINWLSITVYYLIFLACVLVILWASLEIVRLVAERQSEKPRYRLDDSPIGSTPTVNFFPLSMSGAPMVRVDGSRDEFVKDVDKVLAEYKKCKGSDCYNLSILSSCGKSPYGYDRLDPCVYLRLNRLTQWKPEPYTKVDSLPKEMPQSVRKVVESSASPKVWVSCEGSMPKDRDKIRDSDIKFQERGFDPSFFPYTKQKNFFDPIVSFTINGRKLKRVVYSLTCSAWAKNMDLDKTQTEILIYFR